MFYGPDKFRNGKWYYACWAGNPGGTVEDPERCVYSVHESGRGCLSFQCKRKRGHGPDGLFCKQHSKDRFAPGIAEGYKL
jgi:hypothetical protein